MNVPPLNPPHRLSRMRGVLLIFLLIIGPVITSLGHITNNSLDVSLALDLIVYIVAIFSEAFFEEARAQGLVHARAFFAKVLEIIGWLLRQLLNPVIAYAILAILLTTFLVNSFLITPETQANACIQTPLRLLCGNGIRHIQVTIDSNGQIANDGSLINIGLIDEHDNCIQNKYQNNYTPFDQFDATNGVEKDLVNRIFKENCEQADTHDHFTLILATTLSRTVTDNGFSISVGLEELRGAYLAQKDYNSNHTVKLRLLIANFGIKNAVQVTAPIVAAQIALYSRSWDNGDFIGAVGFAFSVTAQQALPILQQYNIQVIGSSPSSDQLSKQPGFYRIEPPDSQQITAIVSFIDILPLPHKNVVVLYDEGSPTHPADPFSNSLGYSVSTSLQKSVTVTPLSYSVGCPSITVVCPSPDTIEDQIPAIQNAKPDLLFFAGYPDDLNALKVMLKRKQAQGSYTLNNMRIMGAQALYELGGYTNDNYANLFFTTFAFPDVKIADASVDFQAEYRNTFDPYNNYPGEYGYQRAGPHSALTYDAVVAFTTAVQKTSGDNGLPSVDKVKRRLTNLPFDGATGWTTFNGRSTTAPSDPTDKLLYFVCTNKDGHTQEVAEFDKGVLNQKSQLDVCT